jgi:hypothetical protein
MSRVRRLVGLWIREASEQVYLWESIVIFFLSACVLLRKDFLASLVASLVGDYEEFFDAFVAMSLEEVSLNQQSSGLPVFGKTVKVGRIKQAHGWSAYSGSFP